MKITKEILEKIIKEEVESLLNLQEVLDDETLMQGIKRSPLPPGVDPEDLHPITHKMYDVRAHTKDALVRLKQIITNTIIHFRQDGQDEVGNQVATAATYAENAILELSRAMVQVDDRIDTLFRMMNAAHVRDLDKPISTKAVSVPASRMTFGQANKAAKRRSGGKPTTFMFDRGDGRGRRKFKTW